MLLIALAACVVVAALAWLGLASVRTWRQVKAFSQSVSAAGERVATASDTLSGALAAGPRTLQEPHSAAREVL